MSDAPILVSVIIPAYRRPDRLRRAVRSVLGQDMDPAQYEVIVVDSTPGRTNDRLEHELAPEARCALRFFWKEPEGPGASRNLGARHARGRILAFTDSDCIADPGWLRAGCAAFSDPRVALVQGRTLPEAGVPRNALCAYVWVERENFIYETANVFYRRDAFEQAGGFPSAADLDRHSERPVGGEDVALAWRVKRLGHATAFSADALVMHEVVRLSPWRWLCEKRLYIFPRLVRDFPELRRFFFLGAFYDRYQALLLLALPGLVGAIASPWALLLAVPYALARLTEPTDSLGGLKRPVRLAAYALRDLVSLIILAAGSVRHGSVLL